MPPGAPLDENVRARFAREARAVAALTHPHICTLYDVGRHDQVDFLVMECLEGGTLAARLENGPLPVTEALTHAIEIAGALEHAHAHGIIHRDLKPANIMLTAGGASCWISVWRNFVPLPQARTRMRRRHAPGCTDGHSRQITRR